MTSIAASNPSLLCKPPKLIMPFFLPSRSDHLSTCAIDFFTSAEWSSTQYISSSMTYVLGNPDAGQVFSIQPRCGGNKLFSIQAGTGAHISLGEVPIEGGGVELREAINFVDIGVDAV